MFSFVSVNTVTFTTALPVIGKYFNIGSHTTGYIITCFIIGCTLGQLIYGPLTNYLGIKNAVRLGALLSIIGAIGGILSYYLHSFYILLLFRFVAAIGAGSGVKLTYTISSQIFESRENVKALSMVGMLFAFIPNIATFLGGLIISFFNWTGPFYLIVLYAFVIFLLIELIPSNYVVKDKNSLKLKNIISGYVAQLKNLQIILGGLVIGIAGGVLYVFTALGPFIGMHVMQLTPYMYGKYCLTLSIGKLLGATSSAYFSSRISSSKAIWCGFIICFCSIAIMCLLFIYQLPVILFLSMCVLYYGLGFIFSNTIALTLDNIIDKSNASAIMSFISTLFSFIIVQCLVFIKYSVIHKLIFTYILLLLIGITINMLLERKRNKLN
ncbi:MAG: hypothetical protein K0R94_1477 [Burkholderiales bacterium]|nr:hypothetical protein [Burkholderiales bacterium]